MNKLGAQANPVLGIICLLSLLGFLAVENSRDQVRQKWYTEKLAAAQHAQRCVQYLKDLRLEKGVFLDAVNDPNQTALIGQEFTQITTDRGEINAKLASTNPNFAGAIVEMLKQAGVKEGDNVAVAFTGSFPAMNIAVLSALETMKLTPLVVTSVGASNWGANDQDFTWLDMEKTLNDAGFIHTRSLAASVGGGGDVGRGLSPEGRALILKAIERNAIPQIREEHLEKSIERRLAVYTENSKGNPIRAYINVGGGIASLGTSVNGDIIPSGLSKTLAVKNYPVRGVIIEMAKRGVPVIHLYNIKELWSRYGLPLNPVPLPEPGSGGVFVQERYNIPITISITVFLFATIVAAAWVDRRKHRLGTEPVMAMKASEIEHEL